MITIPNVIVQKLKTDCDLHKFKLHRLSQKITRLTIKAKLKKITLLCLQGEGKLSRLKGYHVC